MLFALYFEGGTELGRILGVVKVGMSTELMFDQAADKLKEWGL